MHQTAGASAGYVEALAQLRCREDLQLFVILPFTSLDRVAAVAHRAGIWVGAQNMHWAESGEYTGEISAPMLRDLDVDLVLLGHAERRWVFHEDDRTIARKVRSALAHGLRVVLCVGETADERDCGAAALSIARQLTIALAGVTEPERVIVAYEPVWAIGAAGTPPDPAAIAAAAATIRATCDAPLLYGGSVTAASAPGFAGVPGIDGLFVGRAAGSAAGFARTLAAAYPHLMMDHDPRSNDRISEKEAQR